MRIPNHIIPLACGLALTVAAAAAGDIRINNGGQLIVRSQATATAGDVIVESGGNVQLEAPSVTTATTLRVRAGGTVSGCGTIDAAVVNEGTILANCGSPGQMILLGTMTNSGSILVTHGTELVATSVLFINNGLLNHITGRFTTTAGWFVNQGILLRLEDVGITGVTFAGDDVVLDATMYAPHFYQLQFSDDLVEWNDIGPLLDSSAATPRVHAGGVPAAPDGKAFYRMKVTD